MPAAQHPRRPPWRVDRLNGMAPVVDRGGSAPEALRLRGRQGECAALDGLLERARNGQSGVLLLHGEPGVGKTALLRYAIESASDLHVLRAVGVEAERELPFAALHQLSAPLLDRRDRLPAPQRDALETTFGLSVGAVPDRFFVGLAVLGLLAEVAGDRPVLCVVDDAQWLDRASAQALAFVARRLSAEPVVMLFATRALSDEFGRLPELVVEGLRDVDARALLASAIPGRFDERVAELLVAEARGNPLALLELPRGLTAAQLAGGFGLPAALSVQGRIEESFRQRLARLPARTRRLLLVAAAEPTGDPALMWRTAERLGITGRALEPAESAGLLDVGARVRFHHPLVRSAVYAAAEAAERRQAHRALAGATDAQADPDRRAWHLAEAATDPDEDVAAELERAAGRAQARGGLAAAAAFLERAAALTPEPSRRARRALAAAQGNYEAGALDEAIALLGIADGASDDAQRARGQLLRAQIAFASRRGSDAPPALLEAARDLEAVDPTLARAAYLEAVFAALFAGRLLPGAGVVAVSEAALAGPRAPEPPRPSDLLLEGLAVRFTEGHAAGAPILKKALQSFREDSVLPPPQARWLLLAAWVAADLWDEATWRRLSARELDRVREAGALTAVGLVLAAVSYVHALSGDLDAAESLLDEARVATDATGIASYPQAALWVAALRGREADLEELTHPTTRDAVARGEGVGLAIAEHARATLNNGLGRYEAALAAAAQAVERPDEIGSRTWATAELVEAAVRCRERELAERALDQLAQTTRAGGTEFALAIEARSRALLSDGDAAETLYREAIERLTRTRMRLDLARAHLLYGEWLRRDRRRQDAREQLRIAFEMFSAMGIDGFAARARRELEAGGEHVRRPSVAIREDLTAQEAQIARLARDGLSNAGIAERLFISQHTVAYHLRKVFTKLDITSRNQLGGVLPDAAGAGQPA
jgi:DNA-binding CsgD family transcriptional regulator